MTDAEKQEYVAAARNEGRIVSATVLGAQEQVRILIGDRLYRRSPALVRRLVSTMLAQRGVEGYTREIEWVTREAPSLVFNEKGIVSWGWLLKVYGLSDGRLRYRISRSNLESFGLIPGTKLKGYWIDEVERELGPWNRNGNHA